MSDRTSRRSSVRLPPRRYLGLFVLLAISAGLGWLWHRSYQKADALLVFDRGSRLHGAFSHRGAILIGFSTLELNPEKSLSAETMEMDQPDGDWVYDKVFDSADYSKAKLGFGYSEGTGTKAGGIPAAATWSAIVGPHWLLSGIVWLLLARHLWKHTLRMPERKRRRRGMCTNCGYDLRESAGERCPECGFGAAAEDVATPAAIPAEVSARFSWDAAHSSPFGRGGVRGRGSKKCLDRKHIGNPGSRACQLSEAMRLLTPPHPGPLPEGEGGCGFPLCVVRQT